MKAAAYTIGLLVGIVIAASALMGNGTGSLQETMDKRYENAPADVLEILNR